MIGRRVDSPESYAPCTVPKSSLWVASPAKNSRVFAYSRKYADGFLGYCD